MKSLVIIEGANCTGKTTVMGILRGCFPESTFIEFHDFFHDHVIHQLGLKKLHRKEHWDALSVSEVETVAGYLREREKASIRFVSVMANNCTIIERHFVSHVVYAKLLLNLDLDEFMIQMDKALYRLGAVLILLTTEDKILEGRLKRLIHERPDRNFKEAQYHLRSVRLGLIKNNLYLSVYNRLNLMEKHLIVNNDSGIENLKQKLLNTLTK